MSIYNNPTLHHESMTEEVANIVGGRTRLCTKSIIEELKRLTLRKSEDRSLLKKLEMNKEGFMMLEMGRIESAQYWLRKWIPDAYCVIKNGSRLDIYMFEITATNRVTYNQLMKYAAITEILEDGFDIWLYVMVIDPSTRGFSKLDCEMASFRIEEKTGNQWVDYTNLSLEEGNIKELARLKKEEHIEYQGVK